MVKSKNPNKQRKAAFSASSHTKRKRVRARLQSNDKRLVGVRRVTIRVGDQVKVLRGDYGHPSKGKRHGGPRGNSGLEAKVIRVDALNSLVFIEGATRSKADNKEEGVPIHSSNVVVTKLIETDPMRMKRITDRS
ncbi:MAG: 50S ribosomal protein L24 [Candidatus Poseidoniaceae archaeon]|nr:50S ribosomal protein L24 [Candidatus Poseidoniaceae archaeon]MDP7203672.1 50S ribosomal protein L24 [Candidatus Poseidoniaceae archaeon]